MTTKIKLNNLSPEVVSAINSGGAAVLISNTTPVSPSSGTLWFNNETTVLSVYYGNGGAPTWIEVGSESLDSNLSKSIAFTYLFS